MSYELTYQDLGRGKANGRCYCITQNGTVKYCFLSDFEKYALLAEYPTWQEAVNSKEFNECHI